MFNNSNIQIFKLNNVLIHSIKRNLLESEIIKILEINDKPQLITTFNLDFLRISERNREFLHVCKNSLWNLPDGAGLTRLIKLRYKTKVERITGNDIFPLLLKTAEDKALKVALIGSSKEVLYKVKHKIKRNYQLLDKNLKCISPPYLFEKNQTLNDRIINELVEFKPDIVFAALGCPRQEIWLYKNMNLFGSKINIGIGAVLDYYSGFKKRSPVIFRRIGMEWLWRLLNEPIRLFRRYVLLDIPFFVKNVIKIYTSFFFKNRY